VDVATEVAGAVGAADSEEEAGAVAVGVAAASGEVEVALAALGAGLPAVAGLAAAGRRTER